MSGLAAAVRVRGSLYKFRYLPVRRLAKVVADPLRIHWLSKTASRGVFPLMPEGFLSDRGQSWRGNGVTALHRQERRYGKAIKQPHIETERLSSRLLRQTTPERVQLPGRYERPWLST